MKRLANALRTSWRLLALLTIVTVLAVALMPDNSGPAAARYLFQSPPVQQPTPTIEPPTPTPELPTPTPELPTPTPEPPTPPPVEPSPTAPEATLPPAEPEATATLAPLPEPTPSEQTIHLPAVETGAQPRQPAGPEAEQPPAVPSEAPPAATGSEAIDLARLIDGLTVIFSYVWLACGALLLLTVPIALVLFNRWGRRKGQP